MDEQLELQDQIEGQELESQEEIETEGEALPEETDEVEETEGEEAAEGEEQEGEEQEEPAFKPNVKFKAGTYNKETKSLEQKEHEIDSKFHSMMTDPESEKLVRELHEKAYGLDSIKDRLQESRTQLQTVSNEKADLMRGIDELRGIYQTAVKTQNFHKLDNFFGKLSIPQEVILQYAVEKFKLAEMPGEQRQAILGQLEAENRAEEQARRLEAQQSSNLEHAQQMKGMELDFVLGGNEVSPLVQAFDERVGKPGAFREACRQVGEYEWFRSNGQVNLSAAEAAKRVIENYGLTTDNPNLPPVKNAAPQAQPKKVVQRTTQTIPNVQGRATSPLKSKPRSIEDLKKIAAEMN